MYETGHQEEIQTSSPQTQTSYRRVTRQIPYCPTNYRRSTTEFTDAADESTTIHTYRTIYSGTKRFIRQAQSRFPTSSRKSSDALFYDGSPRRICMGNIGTRSFQGRLLSPSRHSGDSTQTLGTTKHTDPTRSSYRSLPVSPGQNRRRCFRAVQFILPNPMVCSCQKGWQISPNRSITRTTKPSYNSTFRSSTVYRTVRRPSV